MKSNDSTLVSRLCALTVGCLASLAAVPANAAIAIPDSPLQAGTAVPPNIVFIIDDSGSMQSEILPDEIIDDVNRRPDGSVPSAITIGRVYPRVDELYGSSDEYADYVADPNNVYGRIVRSPTFNKQYYNPDITYEPWVNADGNSLGNASTTCAYWNPLDTGKGCVDLTHTRSFSDVYWQRTDSSYCDTSACVRENKSSSNSREFEFPIYYRFTGDASSTSDKYDASKYTKVTITDATGLQNFANWFQYYRSRILASRGGIGRAFSTLPTGSSSPRVAFATINTDDALVTKVRPFTGSNRTSFYSHLYGDAIPPQGTPLRSALKSVGDFYKNTTDADDPWRTTVGGPSDDDDYNEYLGCRQSFAMLMTDGYWNGDSDFDVGNVDGTAAYPFADSHSDTLADVAYKYWKDDLRSGIPDQVATSALDSADWQHMVTYGIGLGVYGQVDPDDAFDAIGDASGSISWPDPAAGSDGFQPSNKIDDLLHASVNGRGGFFSAADPDEFAEGLSETLNAIVARAGSGSNVATNSVSVGSDTKVFQASYVAGNWTGELAAYGLTASGLAATPTWRASTQLPAAASRNIFSFDGSDGIEFVWSDLSSAQKTALGSEAVLNYLRGVRTGEQQNGGSYRNRSSLLGDIVDSSPAYVADTGTIYVGANDGMLHAFDADDGSELFAYVPGGVDFEDLATLASATYSHRYFVDGSLAAATTSESTPRNVVVGTLGRGGKGLFALDVSDPDTFDEDDVLWDKTGSAAPANMGLVLGQPIVAKVDTGSGDPVDVVIVGNGPNSGDETAVLYIYNLLTGALIKEIDTGVGSSTAPNGLSTPRGWDADADGVVDLVYAGDLRGNLWRFDLTGNSSQWAHSSHRVVMFAAGSSKPITGSPSIAIDPKTYETWVFFGTGRYLTTDDPSNTATQSLYGIQDSSTTVSIDDLQERTITEVGTIADTPVRAFEAPSDLDEDSKGWYIDWLSPPDYDQTGERVVGDVAVFSGILVVSSVIPSGDDCERGGTGYINALDPFTGAALSKGFFDIDHDGEFDDEVLGDDDILVGSVGTPFMPTKSNFVGIPTTPEPPDDCEGEDCAPPPTPPGCNPDIGVVGGSTGEMETLDTLYCSPQGRISWREISND